MQKINLGVLFGGASSEHDVSLLSAASVCRGLDRSKYNVTAIGITKDGDWYYFPSLSADEINAEVWNRDDKHSCTFSISRSHSGIVLPDRGELIPLDVVFPVLHGENGEDGRVQGMCELAGIPCVGPGCAASAVSMDKSLTKLVAATTGVRQADWMLVTKRNFGDAIMDEIEKKFTYPVFIKPAGTGSSVGTSKARNREQLSEGLSDALRYGGKVLVEEFINAREIETAVLGNDNPVVSVCGEVIPSREFYTYESKYIDNTSETPIPANIPEQTAEEIRAYAKKIYMAIGCRGLSRVDFFIDKDNGGIVFNEINTIPGFTSISMYAKLFDACGIGFSELLDKIIAFAMED
ncbi:MAG: D-alanine--D-alanine ligase [Oscillospiraceae bacterium]|nr:D-alanine--D-alanine ligase [Oscillospiraceae bacterium]